MENSKAFKDVALKYNFPVMVSENCLVMKAKNTDGKLVNWLKYNPISDTISIIGNTDNLNIWLHETRPDMTAKKCVEFVKELSKALNCSLSLRDIVDPEDWQEIASVNNASKDKRYTIKR